MKINFMNLIGGKCVSVEPVLCQEPLTILPEFAAFFNPVNLGLRADGPMGKLGIDPQEAEERKSLRQYLIKNELEKTQILAPFIVWRKDDARILIDARHDEYQVAHKLGLDIYAIEFNFESQYQALGFAAIHQLNKTNLNAAQRMLLVRKLEDVVRKIAKNKQGKRNDSLSPDQKDAQRFHTTKILAGLSNVGEQMLSRFYELIDKGSESLAQEKVDEYVNRIIAGTMSVNAAYNKLKDAKKKKKAKDEFAGNNPDLFPKENGNNFEIGDEDVSDEIVYENPSLALENGGFYNKIVSGDRVLVLKQLPDKFCNLIMTSPEYNVPNVAYDIPVPILPHYEYLRKLNNMWIECARILRDGGRLVVNLPALVSVFKEKQYRSFNTPLFMDVIHEIEKIDIGLNFREALIWHKLSPIRTHHLSSPSPKNPCYRAEHEYLLIFSKNAWEMTPENEGAPSDLTTDVYRENSSSVISIPPQAKGFGNHPAVYPETLVERIVPLHSFIGDTVVDCNVGSGTTLAVSARLGRRWFGCDISPLYCKVANNRINKAYQQFLNNLDESKEQKNEKEAA